MDLEIWYLCLKYCAGLKEESLPVFRCKDLLYLDYNYAEVTKILKVICKRKEWKEKFRFVFAGKN